MKENILYDFEDDAIDRGDSTNMAEAFDALNLQMRISAPERSEDFGTAEAAYHNTYYLGKGKYGTRTIKLKK